MSDTKWEGTADPVLGTVVEEGIERVRNRDPEADPASIRAALERVAEDGVVSRAGVESALGEVAKHVATPETRLELAGDALDAARAAAEPVADLDAVQSRLDGFEARYRGIETEVAELGSRLDRLAERADGPEDVHDLSRSMWELRSDAGETQRRADELQADLDAFESWVSDPDTRVDELDADVSNAAGLLDDLAAAVDRLEATTDDGDDSAEKGAPADADDSPGADTEDLALAWVDATFRRRVIGLLADDLRAELVDLRAWSGEDTVPEGRADEIAARIDDLQAREASLADRLDAITNPAWRDRFGGEIDDFKADLDAVDTPIDWGAVNDLLEEHRSAAVRT